MRTMPLRIHLKSITVKMCKIKSQQVHSVPFLVTNPYQWVIMMLITLQKLRMSKKLLLFLVLALQLPVLVFLLSPLPVLQSHNHPQLQPDGQSLQPQQNRSQYLSHQSQCLVVQIIYKTRINLVKINHSKLRLVQVQHQHQL